MARKQQLAHHFSLSANVKLLFLVAINVAAALVFVEIVVVVVMYTAVAINSSHVVVVVDDVGVVIVNKPRARSEFSVTYLYCQGVLG